MEKKYESKFLTIYYEPENELIHSQWHKETFDATETEMKKEMLSYAACVRECKPKRILGDTSNFLFTVSVGMQTWVAQNFLSAANETAKRYAYLTTDEIVAQLSIEQANDEVLGRNYKVAYFSEEQAAREWLLEK
jgi:hypothetical protein